MNSHVLRNKTIQMRTTAEEKSVLEKAAELAGFTNLTNFILTAARKEANRVLSDINTTYVTGDDWSLVTQLLEAPPEPNLRLKRLFDKRS